MTNKVVIEGVLTPEEDALLTDLLVKFMKKRQADDYKGHWSYSIESSENDHYDDG